MSSLEKAFWCAQLLRCSRISLTRLRSAWPNVLRNTSLQVSVINFSRPDTSHCATGLLASFGSSARTSNCLHVDGAILHGLVNFAFDERREAGFQKLQGFARPVPGW